MLNFAVEKELVESIPGRLRITMPTVDNCVTENLTSEQVKRLLNVLDEAQDQLMASLVRLALSMLMSGKCDRVLCGGLDALCLVPHTGFARLMVYDAAPCRPFDKDRSGLNLGEAAAFMVLERSDLAEARGQRILGRVL